MPSSNATMSDPKAFLETIGAGKKVLRIPKGRTVFAQGDQTDTLFYLQQGRVKISVANDEGKEAVVGIIEPGQFFGEGCLRGQALHTGTTSALQDCVVTAIAKDAMMAALRDHPKLSQMFITFLLARNGRIEADLIDQLFNPSEKRLARLLLLLANYGHDGGPQPIIPKISQEILAEMIGTTRSRVSFFMNKFRKLGCIEYDGTIVVKPSLLHVVLNDTLQEERQI